MQAEVQIQTQTIEKPQWILMSMNGIICPLQWEIQCIEPYVRANVLDFWKNKLSIDKQQEIVMEMRAVTSQDRFALGISNIPLIAYLPNNPSKAQIDKSLESLFQAVSFCLDNNIISVKLQEILKPCWMDGIQNKKIIVRTHSDVKANLARFRKQSIKIGVCSVMTEELCRLVFATTKDGDLNPLIDAFFNQDDYGPRNTSVFYDRILTRMSLKKDFRSLCMISSNGQDVRAAKENGCSGIIIQRADHPIREYYQLRFSVLSSLDHLNILSEPEPIK